ncbi:E3 ubiquitin-protein ligase RNF13-like [Crassostrea virginica]
MANSDECSICKDTFQVGGVTKHLPCAHEFHTACIDKWLSASKTCPNCRERVDGEKGDDDSEDDVSVSANIRLLDNGNGELIPRRIGENRYHQETDSSMAGEEEVVAFPRYIGNYRYHPETGTYMTPERGIVENGFVKMICLLILYFIAQCAYPFGLMFALWLQTRKF